MAQAKASRATSYDSLIIGGGLAGLLVAHELEATGRKVAILESRDVLGGDSRPQTTPVGQLDYGVKFIPAGAESEAAIEWLAGVLQTPIEIKTLDAPPVNFDSGKFQPFVGFGANKAEADSELSSYLAPQHIEASSTPKDWVTCLAETFTGDVLLNSHLTGLVIEDGFVIEVVINGAKRYSAQEIIFTGHPTDLARSLPDNSIPARMRQKLAKGPYFSSIHLEIVHGHPISESQAPHLLRGANEEPLVGLFQPPIDRPATEDAAAPTGQVQVSQWITFVNSQMTDDAELTAHALKAIKRQVKRAYNDAFEGDLYERILVAPASHGHIDIELSEDRKLAKIENLHIASAFFGPNRNTLGSITEARAVIEALQATPVVVDEDKATIEPTLSI